MRAMWRHSLVAAGTAGALLTPLVVSSRMASPTEGVVPSRPSTTNPTGTTGPVTTSPTTTSRGATDDTADAAAVFQGTDVADPFLVVDGGRPWLFVTNNTAGNVPVIGGSNPGELVVSDALPELPAWAAEGFTWAPAVTRTEGGWVLAFTAQHRESGRQCIGVATSTTVGGPYEPADEPLVCDLGRGGSIDASFVADDTGQRWLLYKDDGNCCGLPTTLRAVPLTADATALAGPATDLLTADLAWEDGLIEAPTMRQVGDRWLLVYSANRWDTADYAVGAAWCDTPAGPCEKQAQPALTAADGLDGPGGVEFTGGARGNEAIVTFHAWPTDVIDPEGSGRRLHLGMLTIVDDVVTITPASLGELPGSSQPAQR